uniref:Uncharacterized protein n=1 Tax=Pithovirus LCPAC403 TaxID=2506596 RepID=A0A481ZCY5_9VIRU|nr:MAG: hypothetical protein LCPAC403_03260 [Pithovirus LCPAC403]
MALYQTYSHSGAEYFSDFKKARDFLDKIYNDDFRRISLIKLEEKTGSFTEEEDYVDLHEREGRRVLRELTREELRKLPSKLYIFFTENSNGEYEYTAYINEESALKNATNYYDNWKCLFESVGPLKETYALYVMFDVIVKDLPWDKSFKGTMDVLYEQEELSGSISMIIIDKPEEKTPMEYVTFQSEERLRKVYELARLYIDL